MYLRMIDTPGNAVSHLKDETSVFENLDFVFVVLDGSKVIHKEHVVAINNYVVQRLRSYNKKVVDKMNSDMKYKEYIFKLIDEEPEESGNYIQQEGIYASAHDMERRDRLDVDEEEDMNDSHVGHNHLSGGVSNGMSQHTIANLRLDTYKSNSAIGEEKENADDIINIYKKKLIKPAMFPAIFHIITKKDMLSDEGLTDQTNRAKTLKSAGVIDQFFFISSKEGKDTNGTQDFLEAINDRRLDLIRQEQEEKDSLLELSKASAKK